MGMLRDLGMNNTQRVLMAIYLPFTAFILTLQTMYPDLPVVQYVKYITIVTLFLAGKYMRKHVPEQRLMCLAIFYVVVADFFLVYSTTLSQHTSHFIPYGILCFTAAYLCLIAAYMKNFSLGLAEVICALLIGCTYLTVIRSLHSYMNGWVLAGMMAFGLLLSSLTWISICTVFARYYRLEVALMIALSGIFMFISDIGVAYASFYPAFSPLVQQGLKNVVWAAYIPAWTLVTMVIGEDAPYRASYKSLK